MTLAYSPYRMPSSTHASTSDGAKSAGAELVTRDGRTLPLESVSLTVEAGGGIARAVLLQTFENDTDETLHVTYRMPLPADGAVSGYAFTIGMRTIEGRVDPRKAAREKFEQAILQGNTAAILDQEKDDIFTQEIGNVPPRTRIVARTTVDMRLAWLPEGEWELRFPTVIGPRYVGASATQKVRESVAVDVTEGTVAAMNIEVRLRDELVRPVSSPSHRVRGERVVEAEGTLDRDLVVRWAVAKPAVGVSIMGGGRHALLTIVPPASPSEVTARDLIVLFDTSGSMAGGPIEHGKKVVAALIGSLGKEDRLELVEFSSEAHRWQTGAVFADDHHKRDAIAWIEKLEAGGATEMASAVKSALSPLRPTAQRQVVLVTDGYIGGETEILQLLHERLPAGCRFHFVGVGSAPNRALALALSRAGRGAAVLAAPGEDLERPIKRLLDRTARPVLTDLVIEGAAVLQSAPAAVPDVFAGAPVVIGLIVKHGPIVVRGRLAGEPWERTVSVPVGAEDPRVAALYARERVADLEIATQLEHEVSATDRTIESIGVEYQIATRLTSWVAIDEQKSVDPNAPSRRISVPQELPAGTSLASFGVAAPPMAMALGRAAPLPAGMASMPPRSMTQPLGSASPRPATGGFGAPPPASALAAPADRARATVPAPAPAPASVQQSYAPPLTTPAPVVKPVLRKKNRLALSSVLAFLFALIVAILVYWFFGR